jgi:hypothetical protein
MLLQVYYNLGILLKKWQNYSEKETVLDFSALMLCDAVCISLPLQ